MKEREQPIKGGQPSSEDQRNAVKKPSEPTASEGRKKQKNANAQRPNPSETNTKPKSPTPRENRVDPPVSRFWQFIIDQKHSNAIVAIFTVLIFVTGLLYTIFAALQWSAIRETNGIARDTFNAANRPYVGPNAVQVVFVGQDGQGNLIRIDHPTKQTTNMDYRVEIKNFGTIPASHCRIDWRIFFDGVEQPKVKQVPASPVTLYPTGTQYLAGVIGSEKDYEGIVITGNEILTIETTVSYEWPKNQDGECTKHQYDRDMHGFMYLGKCDAGPVTPATR